MKQTELTPKQEQQLDNFFLEVLDEVDPQQAEAIRSDATKEKEREKRDAERAANRIEGGLYMEDLGKTWTY
ncbi:MAG: hypothetical protein C5B59_00470 [Bacteroidetes bacterium]|nr:MAG: hypothetical protein C5B59_00470 [Bacteroidota bacterium]